MTALGSAFLGFGKECGESTSPTHCVLQGRPGGWAAALWVGARTSRCLRPQDAEPTSGEEEEGHCEMATRLTERGFGGEAQGQSKVRSCPA